MSIHCLQTVAYMCSIISSLLHLYSMYCCILPVQCKGGFITYKPTQWSRKYPDLLTTPEKYLTGKNPVDILVPLNHILYYCILITDVLMCMQHFYYCSCFDLRLFYVLSDSSKRTYLDQVYIFILRFFPGISLHDLQFKSSHVILFMAYI